MKRQTQLDLRTFRTCARNCDRAVIILKGKKRVRWMTEPARQCVAEFFGDLPVQANCLPGPWLSGSSSGPGRVAAEGRHLLNPQPWSATGSSWSCAS